MIVLVCLCVPAAVGIGLLSLRYAAKLELAPEGEELLAAESDLPESNTEPEPETVTGITEDLRKTVKSMGWKSWVVIVLMGLACGGCCLSAALSGLPWLTVFRVAAAALALLSAAVIDGKTRLIPNLVSGGLFVAAAAAMGTELIFAEEISAVLVRSGLGLVICFFLLLLFSVLSRGGFGMGDVKIVSSLGFMLGLPCAMFTMLFGMVVCALTSVGLLITRRKAMKDHIPFAPYIFVGYLICILIGRF